MRALHVLSFIGALSLTLAAGETYGQPPGPPQWVWPGPAGGCPAGYYLGPGRAKCGLNGGGPSPAAPRWVLPGPYGGCPPGYHLGPGRAKCWLNGY
jgi:hypothetical protein